MVETSVKSGFMEVPQHPGRGRKPERTQSFARLEAGATPDQGSTGQGMEPTTERRSLLDLPSLKNPTARASATKNFPKNFPMASKAGCHPTKIPQTRSNRVGRFSQVTSGQHCKVPDCMLIPDDGGGPRKTVWTNDIGLITRRSQVQILPPPLGKSVGQGRCESTGPSAPSLDKMLHASCMSGTLVL